MKNVANVQTESTPPYFANRMAYRRSNDKKEKSTRDCKSLRQPANWATARSTLEAAITRASSTRLACRSRRMTSAHADPTRVMVAVTVGNTYCCRPTKVELKMMNGKAKAEDKPTASKAIRTSGNKAGGIWWNSLGTLQTIMPRATQPMAAAPARIVNEVLTTPWLAARSPAASYSATNFPTAACNPKSRRKM